ncbi:hypothetical protein [Methylohalobius crimeensis]|uniref:hypothetical protein n=1 Tax=Methylohalobius crimeensis TaxID=244365 RepID=UPI0003B49252|nr:hypothetical protein [Methylohalobius crimeensis]
MCQQTPRRPAARLLPFRISNHRIEVELRHSPANPASKLPARRIGRIPEILKFAWKKDVIVKLAWLLLNTSIVMYGGWPAFVFAEPEVQVCDSEGRATNLSSESIREIFFMRQRSWSDGTPIKVFVLPDDNPVHRRFAKEVLGVYPYQLRAAWDRLVYSGTGQTPIQVESIQEMATRLDATSGAIGYVIQQRALREKNNKCTNVYE